MIGIKDTAVKGDVITNVKGGDAANIDVTVSIGSRITVAMTFSAAGIGGNPCASRCICIAAYAIAWAFVAAASSLVLRDAVDVEVVVGFE